MKAVINIKTLIGKLVIVTSKDEAPDKVAEVVIDTLNKAVSSVAETLECNSNKDGQPVPVPDESRSQQ